MKKLIQIAITSTLVVFASYGQQEKGIIGSTNWLTNWTEFKPGKVEYNDSNSILVGNISTNTLLSKRNTYLLQGNVYVLNNAILTIEPGTIIKGDFATKGTLIITKGAQIIADGKETDPIVFTSNQSPKKSGDWGGIVIFGDAPINKFGGVSSLAYELDPTKNTYGGINAQANSGILRYVRIEYAGFKNKGFETTNCLTLAGVGNKTILSNVMCSFSENDSFGIFGGDLVLSKLVSLKANDDDFDVTQGAQVVIDNSIAIRNSYIYSPTALSRCLEVDSYVKKDDMDISKKPTSFKGTNLTFLNDSNSLSEDISSGLVKESVYIGEGALVSLKKSVLSGFKPAVILDKNIEVNSTNFNKIHFVDMFFNNCKGNIFTENNSNNEDLEDWYANSSFFNLCSQGENSETFIDFKNPKYPDYRVQLSKITASNK